MVVKYLLIMDIDQDRGIHQTLPRSVLRPALDSSRLNSLLVATLALIRESLSGNICCRALLSLLTVEEY